MGIPGQLVPRVPLVVFDRGTVRSLEKELQELGLMEAIGALRRPDNLTLFLPSEVQEELESWLAEGQWVNYHFPKSAVAHGSCPTKPAVLTVVVVEQGRDAVGKPNFTFFTVNRALSEREWSRFYKLSRRNNGGERVA